MIKIFDKTETQEKEAEINISKVNINDEYYRIENVDKLQKVLNDLVSDKVLVNIQKINNAIRRAFNRSKMLCLYKNWLKSNDKYKWSKEFREQ